MRPEGAAELLSELLRRTHLSAPGDLAGIVVREALEPGDLLMLYTDGLTEARVAGGEERLGLQGLCQFIEREAAAVQIAPETLRRLRNAIIDANVGELDDDATALSAEWRRGSERGLLPDTV
ncbi:MAG TPA: SpoIIE family protein phosphatase [Baekduia sp.]|nr:SpoIIE family protein phosphatase [Baekduia sp.]